jgi:hypothetical protein
MKAIVVNGATDKRRVAMKFATAAVAVALATVPAQPASSKVVGDWVVETEHDQFADTDHATAFVTRGTTRFGARCLIGGPSLAIIETGPPGLVSDGQPFVVKLRVDNGATANAVAVALNDLVVQIEMKNQGLAAFLKEMEDGQELTVRMDSGLSSYDRVFPIRGAREALDAVAKACNLWK